MRCSRVKTRIDEHADGLLPAGEAEAVRDHLEACGACRDLAFAAKAASASLRQWGDLEPPADGFAKLMARIEALPPDAMRAPAPVLQLRPQSFYEKWAMPAGVAAAAAVVAGFVVGGLFAPNVRDLRPELAVTHPGEVVVHRDPEDPSLRRRFPADIVETRPAANGLQVPVVPVNFDVPGSGVK
jgi:anti-sigma factor RsiW